MQAPSAETPLPAAQDTTIADANKASIAALRQDPFLKRALHRIQMEGHLKRKIILARRKKAKIALNKRRRVFMARRGKRKGTTI